MRGVTMCVVLMAWAGRAVGQDGPDVMTDTVEATVTARSAAELLAELRARGVPLPEGLALGEDGSVRLPAAPPASGVAADAPGVPANSAEADGGAEPIGGAGPGASDEPPAPQVQWKNRAELSFGLSNGNTESSDLRLGYVGSRTTDVDKLRLDSAYYFQKDEARTQENEATAGFLYDRDIGASRWLWFADGRWDWDEFESWDHRVGGHAGVGYKLLDRDDLLLVMRAGAGAVREFGGARDEWIPEALVGADLDWRISERQSLEASFRYLPDLAEGGEFRTITTAGWVMRLDVEKGLSFTAGLAHEHQSRVDPGVEQDDLKLYAGVGLDF